METDRYFQYVRKIYNNNEVFELSDLSIKLRKQFKLNVQEYDLIIKQMGNENLIKINGFNASINLLANPVRSKIYSIISNCPGSYINSLKLLLNLDTHQIVWHLGVLNELKLIQICDIGKIKAFGLKTASREEIIIGCLLFKDSIRRIFELLLSNPQGISQSDISEKTGINRSTLAYILENLGKENLIEQTKVQPGAQFKLNEGILAIVKKRLLQSEQSLNNIK
jgi:predicted transcriptional regulator